MKHLLFASAAALALGLPVSAEQGPPPVRIGVLLGFSGAVESLVPDIADAADLALEEAAASGDFLGGRGVEAVRADSTCTDAAAASTAAERLVTAERVQAILGAACSGATVAVANNVAIPNGILQISPSSTTPALTGLEDDGLFFRTAPSDARQGEVLAQMLVKHGISDVAVTYTNNDYGKGLADAFSGAFADLGGSISIEEAHEDGKADYASDVATLAAAGSEHLVVMGYLDQAGAQIVRTSLDLGAFEHFILPDGMVGESLLDVAGDELEGALGLTPGSGTDAGRIFDDLAQAAGITGTGPYRAEAYDAAALLVLAMQAAGSSDPRHAADHMHDVANAPGQPILPGEIAEGLRILAGGGDIDYVGASDVEFTQAGDATGSFREILVKGGAFVPQAIW